jgi:hypothetical protein
MMLGIENFETFRRKEGGQEEDSQGLLERVRWLEVEIKASQHRQDVLARANHKLSQIIVNHNQKREARELNFVQRVSHTRRKSKEQVHNQTLIACSPNISKGFLTSR